ncbi:peptidoglycan-binding protein LysM [Geoanaerobacter pelophilus]|uniref:Peptidoglycan-binding protein LysM n=1 Tax=Geoanaerobacter pelophilus TaxID=60036 RepID=A0ABQ0MKN9_9BACT|nr:LysM peptidoglycan-binding domain-containing protein [Geoanaerobacter pelophilus]GAW67599.1 peptidoglycan-binding protein LysM [Geoanaerobacter pelophilus]
MTPRNLLIVTSLLALTVSGTVPCQGEEMLLYSPKPAAGEQAPADPKDGVLVQTVTVKRGDTLKDLSRKHIGVASWFPQVLVFNTIKNPDLIYPGDKLLVPVRPGKSTSEPAPASRRRSHRAAHHASHRGTPHAKHRAKITAGNARTVAMPVQAGEAESYSAARKAYLDRNYQRALELFSAFLKNFPRSGYAADASLYRADCYLHLSGE